MNVLLLRSMYERDGSLASDLGSEGTVPVFFGDYYPIFEKYSSYYGIAYLVNFIYFRIMILFT